MSVISRIHLKCLMKEVAVTAGFNPTYHWKNYTDRFNPNYLLVSKVLVNDINTQIYKKKHPNPDLENTQTRLSRPEIETELHWLRSYGY